MNKSKRQIQALISITLALFLTACGGWKYHTKESNYSHKSNFSVEVPAGWVQSLAIRNGLLITKDGPNLQTIYVIYESNNSVFKDIDFEWRENLLPTELAEGIIAKAKKEAADSVLEVVSIEPVTLGGNDAALINIKLFNAEGIEYIRSIITYATKKGVYSASFQAPKHHFYNESKPAFDRVVSSFKANSSS